MRVFPYGALQFTSFELFKTLLPSLGLGWLGKEAHTMKFVAGSLAGLTAVSATFPLDTIRARLAFQVVGETKYQGILHAGGSIMRTEGAVGLYRGLTPTLLGIIPYAGLSFYFFELLKTKLLKHFPWARSKTPSGEMTLVLSAKLLCGGLAGALSQTISYPLDVARWASVNLNLDFNSTRRKMQLGVGGNMRGVLVNTYNQEGIARCNM